MCTNREAGGPAQTAIPQPDPCAPRSAPGPSRASSRRRSSERRRTRLWTYLGRHPLISQQIIAKKPRVSSRNTGAKDGNESFSSTCVMIHGVWRGLLNYRRPPLPPPRPPRPPSPRPPRPLPPRPPPAPWKGKRRNKVSRPGEKQTLENRSSATDSARASHPPPLRSLSRDFIITSPARP